jgi:hypothetical protein
MRWRPSLGIPYSEQGHLAKGAISLIATRRQMRAYPCSHQFKNWASSIFGVMPTCTDRAEPGLVAFFASHRA